MTIKSLMFARAMNNKVLDSGYEIPADETQWRYYNHLAGQYTPYDEIMTVTSLDDNSQIEFTISSLKLHKKTRSVYKNNRSYVDALKERYPEQTLLIMGILNPVDKETAINAKDGAVLYYDSKLVESQETHLIDDVERFARGFNHRYALVDLVTHDDLYGTMMAGLFYSRLITTIIDSRMRVIRSGKTHSFHIKTYLASHQGLDVYAPYLTSSQLMWLYRNINYVEKHTGMTNTFNKLVTNLLTVRRLPLYRYVVRQQSMTISESLTPNALVSREKVNLNSGLSTRDLDLYDMGDIFTKQKYLTSGNEDWITNNQEKVEEKASMARVSNSPTKLLEVAAVDPEDVAAIKLIDVAMNEWLYQATVGTYNAELSVINPVSGDTIKTDPGKMFLLYFYAMCRGRFNITPKEIPVFKAFGILNRNWVNTAEFRNYLGEDPFIGWASEIDLYTDTQPVDLVDPIDSVDFLTQSQRLLSIQRARHQYTYQTAEANRKVNRQLMYQYMYRDYDCILSTETCLTFDDLLMLLGIEPETVSNEEWLDLALSIMDAATNIASSNIISLSDVQDAMVSIFVKLSSYTIQFAQDVISTDSIAIPASYSMVGRNLGDAEAKSTANNARVGHGKVKGSAVGHAVMKPMYADAQTFYRPRDKHFKANLPMRAAFIREIDTELTVNAASVSAEIVKVDGSATE